MTVILPPEVEAVKVPVPFFNTLVYVPDVNEVPNNISSPVIIAFSKLAVKVLLASQVTLWVWFPPSLQLTKR
jgi:hypothetical protein